MMSNPKIEQGNYTQEVKAQLYELYGNLEHTDYVPLKIAEAQALGEDIEPLRRKYAEVLSMRRQWRAKINELETL